MDIVKSPVKPVEVKVDEPAMDSGLTDRQQEVAYIRITHVLCSATLDAIRMQPGIIVVRVQNEGIEAVNRRIGEEGIIELRFAVILLKNYAERLFERLV